jgi:hypothetical protein
MRGNMVSAMSWRNPRVWHLMVAAGLISTLLLLLYGHNGDTGEKQAIGHARVRLNFHVCDAASGRPIKAARIRLVDLDSIGEQDDPHAPTLQTGPDGNTSREFDLAVGWSQGIPSGRIRSYRVNYPPWRITVVAEGYRSAEASFTEIEVHDRRFHADRPPPPIAIQLRRLP